MADLLTGLSGLEAAQRSLDVIGQNVSNADTPGYHRQVVDLVARPATEQLGLLIGSGVDVATVLRQISRPLEEAINSQASDASAIDVQLQTLNQAQSALAPGTGSLQDRLDNFFTQVEQLTSKPDDPTQRQVVLTSAAGLASQFNAASSSLSRLSAGLDAQILDLVGQVNVLAPQIAQLNQRIQQAEVNGQPPNDLLDQRDQLVNQLAQIASVRTVPQDFGQMNVFVAGAPVVVGTTSTTLQVKVNAAGPDAVFAQDAQQPLAITGGKLGGVLQVRNQTLPAYQNQLNTLAQTLIRNVDEVQATGLGLSGPLSFLSGTRSVSSVTTPLAQANLAFPPRSGSLFIGVTNLATGQRTVSKIQVDPATESLTDLAAAITGVGHVQAVAESQTGTLKILAQPGYAFDFTGRVASTPDTQAITGTSTVQLSGTYTGGKNDQLTFTVLGSGTVGVTPNLTLKVEDSAGHQVASVNIGQGYSPSTALAVGNGVTVILAAGTVNDGDSFTAKVVAQPDTAGILSALGLKSFFQGEDAATIGVQPGILNDPTQLAGSTSGQPGDGSNLAKLAALQDQPLLGGGSQTLSQYSAALIGQVGTQVKDLTDQQTNQKAVGQQLQAQQQSISGVDPNQELVNMIQAQRAFQMSARYIDVVNQTLKDFIQMIG